MQTLHRAHFKDSRDMQAIDSASVELVVTSPPYPMIEMWDEGFSVQNPAVRKALKRCDGRSAFALMHAGGNIHAGETVMCKSPGVHGWDDDADHFAARFESAIRHGSHETGLPAAEDQAESSFSQEDAQFPRGRQIVRVNRIGRSTKNANRVHKSVLLG